MSNIMKYSQQVEQRARVSSNILILPVDRVSNEHIQLLLDM